MAYPPLEQRLLSEAESVAGAVRYRRRNSILQMSLVIARRFRLSECPCMRWMNIAALTGSCHLGLLTVMHFVPTP